MTGRPRAGRRSDSTRSKVILCGGLGWDDRMETPNPDCPRVELHTPCPSGYTAWHDWAARNHYERRAHRRCPGCDLYVVVAPEPPGSDETRARLAELAQQTASDRTDNHPKESGP